MVRLLHYSDLENVYDDPERAGRLAGLLSALDGPDALVVGAGDDTAPGVLALVARGRQAIDFFAAAGTDVETFGNHDFDFGPDATRAVVAESPQTWVSANVVGEDGDRFGREEGVVPWTILTADGTAVGFVGVTDPATDSLNPKAAPLGFTEPLPAARSAAAACREAGADYIVAVSHLGSGDEDLARRVDVDLVLGGHVHTRRVEMVDGTTCTRPGVNGESVIEVELDDDGARATVHEPDGAPVDERLEDALRERMAAAGLDEVVGHARVPVARTEETIHGGESRIGNLVADAYRRAADADVGLQNAGGIRLGDPLSEEVTLADLISVLPFEEPVVTAELTGEELLEAFRQLSGAGVDFGEPGWWHGHVSGAEVVWDAAAGELLAATVDGRPVDPDATYRVATAEYLLHSDHEFPVVGEHHRAGEHGVQHEVLAEYVREVGLDPRVEGRIRRVNASESRGAGEPSADGPGSSDDCRVPDEREAGPASDRTRPSPVDREE